MIILGIICLLIGYLVGIGLLVLLGWLLLAIGLILLVVGTAGPVGGRWY